MKRGEKTGAPLPPRLERRTVARGAQGSETETPDGDTLGTGPAGAGNAAT